MNLEMDSVTSSIDPATLYALEVVEGRQVAGKLEILACKRHLDDLERQNDPGFSWRYDEEKAARIYKWFQYCRHVEGPLTGQPITLEPFQAFDLGCIFGWVHKETGFRRFEKAYIQMARKNGKTTILAGVALYLMVGDKEYNPAVYCAAVDRSQARLMYEAGMAMGELSPDIGRRLRIRNYRIIHRTRKGKMMALSKDTKNKDGLNPSGAIIDEYHAHPTSEIYDLLWSAWGQRSQALMVIITTAGLDLESPCYSEYQYCKSILVGAVENERYFVSIRQLDKDDSEDDKGDDEHDPENWIKANPLRAATPESIERLKQQHDEAFGSRDPQKIRTWRVKNLNVWLHAGEDSYMGEWMEEWDRSAISREDFQHLTADRLSEVGLDLSMKIDLTASGRIFVLDDGRVAITAHGFMPRETVKKHEQTDRTPYWYWADEGHMTITEGEVTDYAAVQDYVLDMEIERGWKIHEICYDPYNATHLANDLMDMGYICIEIRQGVKTLSEPTKLFREMVASGQIIHDGNPLLRWCIANAIQVEDHNENIRVAKKSKGSSQRIDLLAAVLNAFVRYQALRDATLFQNYVDSDEFGF